jgi:hypothetical protein
MKKKLVIRLTMVILLLSQQGKSYAQDSVYVFKEGNVQLNIPNSHWHLQPKQEKNGYTIYVFKRDPVLDSSGRNIIPNAAVIIEKVQPKTDVIIYSVNKRANGGFDVIKVFSHEDGTISYLNAVGYKGTYTDQIAHTVYVVHAINGDKGLQIILDTTTETFEALDPEFQRILKSFEKTTE